MNVKNYVKFDFPSLAENVSFARSCVAAFASQLDCTLDEIEEIKLVVSEAVSNCIIHAYDNQPDGRIVVSASLMDDRTMDIVIKDYGIGIANIEEAMEATFSSNPERMGLGFTLMKSFMDNLEVISQAGEGTTVKMKRSFMVKDEEAFA